MTKEEDFAEKFLKFLVDTGRGKLEEAESLTLVDTATPEGGEVQPSFEDDDESVEGKDITGNSIEIEGGAPKLGGKVVSAKHVYDMRDKDKDLFVLKWDARRGVYVKTRKKIIGRDT